MDRSLFADAPKLRRNIVNLAFLALIVIAIFGAKFPFKVLAQQLVAENVAMGSVTENAVLSSTEMVFIDLAASVGQTASAKRLIDYKLKNDPASRQRYYAIVDFSQPSTSKRLYVFDTVEKKVESYYVAHGRGSGENIAERFSNMSGSNSSSLGIYKTLDEYDGHHGRSLRLEGLEPTNSNAFSRAVVMHTADYVSDAFIRQTGRLGRSEGCFAVEKAVGDTLIDELKDGAYIIATKD
jgi:hypothetical protein